MSCCDDVAEQVCARRLVTDGEQRNGARRNVKPSLAPERARKVIEHVVVIRETATRATTNTTTGVSVAALCAGSGYNFQIICPGRNSQHVRSRAEGLTHCGAAPREAVVVAIPLHHTGQAPGSAVSENLAHDVVHIDLISEMQEGG